MSQNLVTDLFALPFRTAAYGMNLMARTLQETQKWIEEGTCSLEHGKTKTPCCGSSSEPRCPPGCRCRHCCPPTPEPLPKPLPAPIVNVPPVNQKISFEEQVLVVYHIGTGKFSNENPPKYINLQMDMYDFHGRWIGYQYGVHLSLATAEELFAVPDPPQGGFQDPNVPIPKLRTNEWTKGVWTFEDGSEIFAAGPAFSHLVPFNDGSYLFMVTTGQTITSGSGRFKGIAGVKEATGTAYVPPGLLETGQFPKAGLEFPAKTIETFRFLLAKDYTSLAPAGPPEPEASFFPAETLSAYRARSARAAKTTRSAKAAKAPKSAKGAKGAETTVEEKP